VGNHKSIPGGVRLTGKLTGWASAKDVIFEMLRRFTVGGGTGKIIEYFGPGAGALSATQKATITNMGAELGATSSVFVYDESMDAYLRNVGRKEDADQARLWSVILRQDEYCLSHPEKIFDEIVELDLEKIRPAHAGPFSPDRNHRGRRFQDRVALEKWPEDVSAVLLGSCTTHLIRICARQPRYWTRQVSTASSPRRPVVFTRINADFRDPQTGWHPGQVVIRWRSDPFSLLRALYRPVG